MSDIVVNNDGGPFTIAAPAQGPQGPAGTIAIGTVTTGIPGSDASVTNAGTPQEAILDIAIPRGNTGTAATVAIGTVTTGAPGTDASVTNAGTSAAAVLDFTIPRGDTGAPNAGYAATSAQSKAVVATGSVTFSDVDAGLDYLAGARMRATSTGSGEWMEGLVTAYSGTSLTATMDRCSGSGTHADWNINLAGEPGAAGAAGADGVFSEIASQAEAEAGTDTLKGMNALRVAQAIAALAGTVPTGTMRPTLQTTAATGWLMMNDGSIGSASSGATYANSDAQDLFMLIFNNIVDANCAIQTSAGGATTRAAQTNAATAWANNCRIFLPKVLGRAFGGAGGGAGLTSRPLASTVGEESHTPTLAEMYAHAHTFNYRAGNLAGGSGGNSAADGGSTAPTSTSGSSSPFNVMEPTTFFNWEIKL